ncbi:hypothetical protein BDV97DRAFT_365348 [Delphinella strobiligena]|nr:hypothetical protein BDV97DRAFT_365348 [Delphinella strobiligena]
MGAFLDFLPFIVLLTLVAIGAFVGYHMYIWSNELTERGKRKMEKKNVSFSKDGMKVGVKHINDEDYADRTQNYLIRAWNYSSFPAYKSRLGWNPQPANTDSNAGSTNAPKVAGQSTAKSTSSNPGLYVPKESYQRSSNPGAFPQT